MILSDISAIDYCWRLVLSLGAVPDLAALYFRLTIPETPRYTMDIERDLHKASKDITSYLQKTGETKNKHDVIVNKLVAPRKWKNRKVLLALQCHGSH